MCKEKLSIIIAMAIQKEDRIKREGKNKLKRSQAIWSVLTLGVVYNIWAK